MRELEYSLLKNGAKVFFILIFRYYIFFIGVISSSFNFSLKWSKKRQGSFSLVNKVYVIREYILPDPQEYD